MSETYVTYKIWDGCKAPTNLEYNGRLIGQIVRESAIDRDALLDLADEMDMDAGCHAYVDDCDVFGYAHRIRKILGEDS